MSQKCRKCGQRTSHGRRVCKDCSRQERWGVPSDHFDIEGDDDDQLERDDGNRYECTACGCVFEGVQPCPDCGARRRRYVGDLGGASA